MRVTASKVGLLSACQYFARAEAEWSDTTSAAADRGTRFHRAIAEYVSTGQVPPALDEDIAALFVSAKAWVDHFRSQRSNDGALAAEVAFAWDPETDTAEHIPAVERDYQAGAGRLCGTADLVAVSRCLKVGYIADWKTGDASRSGPQLRALALMLARAEGLDLVTVEALEVDALGVRHVCTEALDAFALAAIAGELAEALAAVPTAKPQPGAHCGDSYCPARATCPAIVERVADIIPAAELVRHKWGVTIAGADHAAWLYAQAKAVEAAAKLVKDAVRAYVPEEGLQLSDGSVLREGSCTKSYFNHARAVSLLVEKGATPKEIEACSVPVKVSTGLRPSGGAVKSRKRRAA